MRVLLIVYDNGSHIPFFPQGIAYLAGALTRAGHFVNIFQQDITHAPDEDITVELDTFPYDVVGLGFVAGYYQFKKALTISGAVNKTKNRHKFRYVLGGHGPAAAPDYFRKKMGADTVFVGEAEQTIVDYLDNGGLGNIVGTENCGLCDPDEVGYPAYDKFPISVYRLIRWPTSQPTDFCFPVLSGRGCKWKCTFCYRMDPGFRPRSPENVIEEMIYLNDNFLINHFQFSDELFMSSEERATLFCEKLLEVKIPNFKWDCSGRLNFAKPELLKLMRRAGCEYVNYGIEAMDDVVLRNIKKGLTVERIKKGVKDTLAAGLSPGLNLMWGNIGDTQETLQKAVRFLLDNDPCHELRTIRPVTPYPGSPLFDKAVELGLVADVADFYENKHVNSDLVSCNFTALSTPEMHQLLEKANAVLIQNYLWKRRNKSMEQCRKLYQGDASFRGFRAI